MSQPPPPPDTPPARPRSQPPPPPDTPSAKRHSWTRPDIINLTGVVIALLALTAPWAYNVYRQHFQEPRAAIEAPRSGQVIETNQIAVKGTAANVPADSNLWLSASGPSDEVYPIAELQVNAGRWSADKAQVCFRVGPGMQRIDVWMSPDTDDGAFVGYMQKNNTAGFFSVPRGFIKLSQVDIYIRHALNNC
jgi:hypothetical protein